MTPLSPPRTITTPLAGGAEPAAAGAILGVVGKAYETAREGGKYSGMYRRYRDEGTRQIEKSMRSFQGLIRAHEG